MTDNSLFLPFVITLIFWAYREASHLIDKGNCREDRREEREHLQSILNPPVEWGGSHGKVAGYHPDAVYPQPDEELTPEQLKEREQELAAKLRQERLEELRRENLARLTSESEAEFTRVVGS